MGTHCERSLSSSALHHIIDKRRGNKTFTWRPNSREKIQTTGRYLCVRVCTRNSQTTAPAANHPLPPLLPPFSLPFVPFHSSGSAGKKQCTCAKRTKGCSRTCSRRKGLITRLSRSKWTLACTIIFAAMCPLGTLLFSHPVETAV